MNPETDQIDSVFALGGGFQNSYADMAQDAIISFGANSATALATGGKIDIGNALASLGTQMVVHGGFSFLGDTNSQASRFNWLGAAESFVTDSLNPDSGWVFNDRDWAHFAAQVVISSAGLASKAIGWQKPAEPRPYNDPDGLMDPRKEGGASSGAAPTQQVAAGNEATASRSLFSGAHLTPPNRSEIFAASLAAEQQPSVPADSTYKSQKGDTYLEDVAERFYGKDYRWLATAIAKRNGIDPLKFHEGMDLQIPAFDSIDLNKARALRAQSNDRELTAAILSGEIIVVQGTAPGTLSDPPVLNPNPGHLNVHFTPVIDGMPMPAVDVDVDACNPLGNPIDPLLQNQDIVNAFKTYCPQSGPFEPPITMHVTGSMRTSAQVRTDDGIADVSSAKDFKRRFDYQNRGKEFASDEDYRRALRSAFVREHWTEGAEIEKRLKLTADFAQFGIMGSQLILGVGMSLMAPEAYLVGTLGGMGADYAVTKLTGNEDLGLLAGMGVSLLAGVAVESAIAPRPGASGASQVLGRVRQLDGSFADVLPAGSVPTNAKFANPVASGSEFIPAGNSALEPRPQLLLSSGGSAAGGLLDENLPAVEVFKRTRAGNARAWDTGTGNLNDRALNLVGNAAKAAGYGDLNGLSGLVDDIFYGGPGESAFGVFPGTRSRYLRIGGDTFNKTSAGQLIDAIHEIGHSEAFAKRVQKMGFEAARAEFGPGNPREYGSPLYAHEEQVVERLARWRANDYLGGLSPQQTAASARYEGFWRAVELGLITVGP
jgi:hypothetical protein